MPVARLRHLEAIERHAPAEVIAEAEAEEAERAERKRAASARLDAVLASATPEDIARAERIADRMVAQNR